MGGPNAPSQHRICVEGCAGQKKPGELRSRPRGRPVRFQREGIGKQESRTTVEMISAK